MLQASDSSRSFGSLVGSLPTRQANEPQSARKSSMYCDKSASVTGNAAMCLNLLFPLTRTYFIS
jgi:hypothetical protein